MKLLLIVVFSVVVAFVSDLQAQVLENPEEAFRLSRETQKPLLLVFSGSDWCAPCIRFNKNVLSQEDFIHFASDHFILLKADFPQRKKLPDLIRQQNEKLAERFNPTGLFPHILLLNPDESKKITLIYRNQKSSEFISELSGYFSE
ncbi:MAG: thioredoxin family protein [Cyclobacteriaceae bacterium]